jgi:hypothetical protein
MINAPSTLNILLRHLRSLIPFVIVLLNTRQTLIKVNPDNEGKFFFQYLFLIEIKTSFT